MDIKKEIVVIESVGGIDGPLACEDVVINNLDMESVRPTPSNSLENDILQLVVIQVQATL
jgi:hypothetical protein